MGTGTYLLDKEHLPIFPDFEVNTVVLDEEHLPLWPDFEDNTVVMDAEDPTSVEAHEKKEKAKAEKAAKMPSDAEASEVLLKSKQDQLRYLIQASLRIEKGLDH